MSFALAQTLIPMVSSGEHPLPSTLAHRDASCLFRSVRKVLLGGQITHRYTRPGSSAISLHVVMYQSASPLILVLPAAPWPSKVYRCRSSRRLQALHGQAVDLNRISTLNFSFSGWKQQSCGLVTKIDCSLHTHRSR